MTTDKIFLIGLIVWIVLQLSRLIAISLINEVNAGAESKAWLYPAYLDLFAAVFALPLVWSIAKYRGFLTWTSVIIYLAISIVDHVGNFVPHWTLCFYCYFSYHGFAIYSLV